MRKLAPTFHYDGLLILETGDRLESFEDVRAEVLLIGGSKSPPLAKDGHAALERVLPRARRVELPGVGHAASWNADRGGRPEPVARELRRFFAGA